MADCCEGLRQELAQLRAEIAKIKPVDEQRIIQASIAGAEQLIVPGIIAYIASQIGGLQAAIATIGATAATALSTAKTAAATLAALAAKVAVIAAAIAGVLAAVAAVQVLGSRIDAVENEVGSISSDMSRLWGILGAVKGIAEGARDTANRALGRADQADSTANKAIFKADNATTKAQQAIEKANKAIDTANNAITRANNAQALAIQAGQQAREAAIRANTAINTANLASGKADQAINDAKTAVKRANEVAAIAQKAIFQSEQAINDAKTAIKRANELAATAQKALTQSEQAIVTSNTALTSATTAQKTAESAITKAETANKNATEARQISQASLGLGINNNLRITNTDGQVTRLNNDLNFVKNGVTVRQAEVIQAEVRKSTGQTLDGIGKGLADTYKQTFDAKALEWSQKTFREQQEFLQQLKQGTAGANLWKQAVAEVDAKVNKFAAEIDVKTAIGADAQAKANAALARLNNVESQSNATAAAIPAIQAQTRENERLNREGLNKLDQIIPTLAGIPAIPAAAAALIRPAIPTLPQIRTAAASGVCQTAQPGGCLNTALNNQTGNILNGLKNNLGNALGAANAAANAAQLALLNTINSKLGEQIIGGIGGKLSRISQFLQLGRVLDALTFAATVHNALMLSNDIGQTLLGIIGNILQLLGIKDDEGNAINVGGIIGSSVENLIKGAIGAENYTELKESFAKANRIYQATTNVLNSFLNVAQTILQASELIAAYTGKIGNALRKGGIILENAYGWMNPQPKFNRVSQFLENFQQGASTIQMVTQAPLDIATASTEFTNSATEFIKAVKEDDKPENKAQEPPEPEELKTKETQAKAESQPLAFDFSDLFDGED
jgi:hypothetical protein